MNTGLQTSKQNIQLALICIL